MAAPPPPPLPAHVGPCEFETLGAMVAVRCPQEFADIVLRAGGLWEPGSEARSVAGRTGPFRDFGQADALARRRMGSGCAAMADRAAPDRAGAPGTRRDTDPLFRRAGMDLDDG